MKQAQRLRLEPRPSCIAGAAIIGGCVATCALIPAMRLPTPGSLGCVAIVLVVFVSSLWRCAGRGVAAIVHVGIDRTISVTDRSGRTLAGVILDDSYVGAALTTIVWRADGDRWWHPARAMLIVPDSLPPDEFRRLRVVLRYGRAVCDEETSGVDAG
ncbi:MAG TPA: hypothetical protein VFJ68_08325 [Casimicrobiaceae bacterium]|nr:hypothetical protein [Casimicrobiaceae bacterium]